MRCGVSATHHRRSGLERSATIALLPRSTYTLYTREHSSSIPRGRIAAFELFISLLCVTSKTNYIEQDSLLSQLFRDKYFIVSSLVTLVQREADV